MTAIRGIAVLQTSGIRIVLLDIKGSLRNVSQSIARLTDVVRGTERQREWRTVHSRMLAACHWLHQQH